MALGPSYKLPKIHGLLPWSQSTQIKKTKTKPRSTYPKTPNSEAKLRNGKVLGTHSTQTESGFLDSHDQYSPLCMI